MLDLSVIILTKDEKLHIARCLERLLPLFADGLPRGYAPRNDETSTRHCERSEAIHSTLPPSRVFLVDCHSTDGTQEIARAYGAEVVEHAWPGTQALQFNWALDNLPIKTKWVLRLDADEYLYPETIEEVKLVLTRLGGDASSVGEGGNNHSCLPTQGCVAPQRCAPHDSITSLSLSRARAWQGRVIRRGTGKVILKRFFRYGIGRCEERMMDEHIVTSYGRDLLLKGEFVDDNLNSLRWWTEKHLGYAEREACDLLMAELEAKLKVKSGKLKSLSLATNPSIGALAGRKRKMKGRYGRLPLFWRSFAYFCYRYFLRGGFLEGKAGFTWHFFQGWWYRTMVDARILEIKKLCNNDPEKIRAYLARKRN